MLMFLLSSPLTSPRCGFVPRPACWSYSVGYSCLQLHSLRALATALATATPTCLSVMLHLFSSSGILYRLPLVHFLAIAEEHDGSYLARVEHPHIPTVEDDRAGAEEKWLSGRRH